MNVFSCMYTCTSTVRFKFARCIHVQYYMYMHTVVGLAIAICSKLHCTSYTMQMIMVALIYRRQAIYM